ncbi:MAG TPA: hypothetical protein VN085_06975, partial [Vicinamibacterales bacterium]|nr:hypothetical protein [Vicinamibacterales bacterium]
IRWRIGSGSYGGRMGSFSNGPHGAAIYYYLKDEDKNEVRIEIVDAQNKPVRTLSSTVREPDYSDDNEMPDEFKDMALSKGPGVQRAVWDLRYEGARKIQNGKIDTGDPAEGPMVPPGTYTVKLTAAGQTLTAPLKIVPDPRSSVPQDALEAQAAFGLRVRDDISRLTDLVNQLRSVRDQLKARSAALEPRKAEQSIADLIKTSDAAMKKADALEDKLHNPTAEVVYDILAMRGGTRLYSRLAPLQMWAVEDEGLPTLGMKTVLEEQEQELEALSAEVRQFMTQDVAAVNQRAAQLGLAYVIVK